MRAPSPPTGEVTITLFVPGILRSRLNGSGSRAHWSKISAEARRWRQRVHWYWLAAGQPTWRGPATVTFTAYVKRPWDDDNLPAAIKSLRDEACVRILQSDDGPTCGHAFKYAQETGHAV